MAARQETPPGRLPVQEGNQVARIAIGEQAVETETGTRWPAETGGDDARMRLWLGGNA